MLKDYFDFKITITMVCIIILNPLLPPLAHGQQQFALANQTLIKNKINNNRQNKSSSYYSFSVNTRRGENNTNNTDNSTSTNHSSIIGNKIVILNFYDDVKSQITNAKPILDKYGFKGTFFIVCDWAGTVKSQTPRMTWQDITQLYREGHDIESHTMTHKRLDQLSSSALDYEVGQSKQCIYDHIGEAYSNFSST